MYSLLVNVQFIITLKYSTELTKKNYYRKKYILNSVFKKARNNAEFRGIKHSELPRNSAELKSLPHKIPYSAEFQKVTSVDTLFPCYSYTKGAEKEPKPHQLSNTMY
jgi:hypothetical protein